MISDQINQRYEINHAEKGYNTLNVQELTVDDKHIKIQEENTGRKAELTLWDEEESVPPGDIVKVQFLLNGQKSQLLMKYGCLIGNEEADISHG